MPSCCSSKGRVWTRAARPPAVTCTLRPPGRAGQPAAHTEHHPQRDWAGHRPRTGRPAVLYRLYRQSGGGGWQWLRPIGWWRSIPGSPWKGGGVLLALGPDSS